MLIASAIILYLLVGYSLFRLLTHLVAIGKISARNIDGLEFTSVLAILFWPMALFLVLPLGLTVGHLDKVTETSRRKAYKLEREKYELEGRRL